MKKLLKILGAAALLLLAIPTLLYFVVVLCNLRDDELEPEVAKLLNASPPQIADVDNGYFAWIGVVGPESATPHAWGKRWFEEALTADKKPPAADGVIALAIDGEERKEALTGKDIPCDKVETCLEEVIARPAEARAALTRGRITLDRCDTAVALPAYQEPWRPNFSLASRFPSPPHLWRQLSSTRFALAIAENRHDEALDRLGREMAFHVRQMQGAESLIEKVIAQTYLRKDYLLLSQYMLHQPKAARARAERIATLLAKLPDNATAMRPVMETEWRWSAHTFLVVRDQMASTLMANSGREDPVGTLTGRLGDALAAPTFLPNATINALYQRYRPLFELDSKSGAQYRAALAAIKDEQQPKLEGWLDFCLRNPIGHILMSVGTPSFAPYFFKRDDLLAVQAAVAFQLDLLRRGVTDPDAIAQALPGAGLIHPYTGETPIWNRTQRTLNYQAQHGRKDQPLVLAL